MGLKLDAVSEKRKIDVPVGDGTVALAIHASKTNTGQRPNIVFIHGNSLSSKMFADQLGDSKGLAFFYDVYAIDLPGHGDSTDATPETESCYSIDGFPQAMVEAVKILRLEPASTIVFGHSLGGHIGIRMLQMMNLAGIGITGTPPFDIPIDMEPRFVMDDPNMGLLFKPEKYSREEAETRTRGQLAPDFSPLPEVGGRSSELRGSAWNIIATRT
jgi:pimeloyl-ACP methyl ester carboxylesterase